MADDWMKLLGSGTQMLDDNNNISTDTVGRAGLNYWVPGLGSAVVDNDLEGAIAGLTGTEEALGAYRNYDQYAEGKVLGAATDAIAGNLPGVSDDSRAQTSALVNGEPPTDAQSPEDEAAMAEIQALEQPPLPYGNEQAPPPPAQGAPPAPGQPQADPQSPAAPGFQSGSVQEAMDRQGDSEANLHLVKAQGYMDRANELEKQSNAQILESERQERVSQVATDHANDRLKEITETEIDPMRAWNDAPIYGKVIAALFMMTGHPQVMNIVGKYMSMDLEAQKKDRNSQLNYWTTALGDAKLGEKAAALKMTEGLAKRMEQQKALAGSEEEMASAQVGLDKVQTQIATLQEQLQAGIKDGKIKGDLAANVQREREARMAIAKRGAAVGEGQLGVQRGRLKLERQKRLDAKASTKGMTSKQMLAEKTAAIELRELERTGLTPERAKEVRAEVAKVSPQLTEVSGVEAALKDLQGITGITRGKDGRLMRSNDMAGVGWWDSSTASNLSGGRSNRINGEIAKKIAIDALGRMKSGGAILEDEVKAFTEMIGNTSNEAEFFIAQNRIDSWIRGIQKNIRAGMSDEAAAQYARNNRRVDASAAVGHGKPETGKLLTAKERKRAKTKAIVEGK